MPASIMVPKGLVRAPTPCALSLPARRCAASKSGGGVTWPGPGRQPSLLHAAPQASCLLWGPADMTAALAILPPSLGHQGPPRSLWRSQQDPAPRPALENKPDRPWAGSAQGCSRPPTPGQGGLPCRRRGSRGVGSPWDAAGTIRCKALGRDACTSSVSQQAVLRLRGDGLETPHHGGLHLLGQEGWRVHLDSDRERSCPYYSEDCSAAERGRAG